MDTLLSRLRARQVELGFHHKKALGQNFLVTESVVQKIVAASRAFSPQSVIEVGPGLGSLTDELSRLQARYMAIELDRRLVDFWRAQKLQVVEADALQLDWAILKRAEPSVLVSNLPYQISSRLLVDRCLDAHPFAGMVLMFQKEVAQKILCRSGEREFGFLAALVQSCWKVKFLLEAAPRDFDPAPKVASRVLVFEPLPNWDSRRARHFLDFLKAAFTQPRQTLVKNLEKHHSRDELKELLAAFGLSPTVRPHQLSLEQFQGLSSALEKGKRH